MVVTSLLVGNLTALAVQPDGKILLAGGGGWMSVLRLEADGSIDTSFGTAGIARHPTTGNGVTALALQPDGAIVVGSDVTNAVNEYPSDAAADAEGNLIVVDGIARTVVIGGVYVTRRVAVLVRFEPNGTLDANFGTGGGVMSFLDDASYAYAIAVAPDGTLVLAGSTGPDPFSTGFAVARFEGGGR